MEEFLQHRATWNFLAFSCLLRNPKVHCRVQQFKPFDSTNRTSSTNCKTSCNKYKLECFSLKMRVISVSANPHEEGPPAVGCTQLLSQHIGSSLLYVEEDLPVSYLKTRYAETQEIRLKCNSK